jgi:hypothetical protein
MRSDRFATAGSLRRDGAWPRVYRASRGHRVFLGGLGGLALLGGIAGAALVLLRPPAGAPGWLAVVPVAFALLGVYLLAALVVERVVLHEEAIEFVELGRGRRRFRRDEIAGRRVFPLQYGMEQGTLGIGALLAASDPALRRRVPALALLVALVAAYPWALLAQANALLDRSPRETFRVTVVGKHVSTGKHTSYELRLAPWGPVEEEEDADVGRATYEAVAVGDAVCALLRGGALGVRWYVVGRCP